MGTHGPPFVVPAHDLDRQRSVYPRGHEPALLQPNPVSQAPGRVMYSYALSFSLGLHSGLIEFSFVRRPAAQRIFP